MLTPFRGHKPGSGDCGVENRLQLIHKIGRNPAIYNIPACRQKTQAITEEKNDKDVTTSEVQHGNMTRKYNFYDSA